MSERPVAPGAEWAGDVLCRASLPCMQMICTYYNISPNFDMARYGAEKLVQHGIPLDVVVNRHLPLLQLDQAMQVEVREMQAETQALCTEMQREETHALVTRIAWYGPRLRIYRQISCRLCKSPAHRTDVTFVRVWPKSVTVRITGHPHKPLRNRLRFNAGWLCGYDIDFSEQTQTRIACELATFHRIVCAALPLVPDLLRIVLPYVGPDLYILPDGTVGLDFD